MQREFNKALEMAQALFDPNYHTRVQVFSFGFHRGRLIAVGRNKDKTHPLNLRNVLRFDTGEIHREKGICGELSLFLTLKKTTNIPFNKIVIVNVRLDKNRNVKMSRPCNSCSSLCAFIQPKALYYTDDNGVFQKY